MITLLNRKEILSTTDQTVHSNARDILAEADIEYTYKTENTTERKRQTGTNRSDMVGYFTNTLYFLYVHRDDYEKALEVLNAHHSRIYSK